MTSELRDDRLFKISKLDIINATFLHNVDRLV